MRCLRPICYSHVPLQHWSSCARRNFGATPEFTQAKRDGALETGHPLRWLVSRRGAKTRRVVAKLACVEACGMVGFCAAAATSNPCYPPSFA
mgnify:CR=1 FL=1